MPKQSEMEQKPIYIPRNVYVPVIRPVFVPRERIIVKPQIIHVARPVLVDRPIPVQQKPIVIERDRPIPVRVETVEKIENIETTLHSSSYHEEAATEYVYNEVHNVEPVKVETITAPVQEPVTYDYQYESNKDEKLYNFATLDLNKYYNDPEVKFVSTDTEVVTTTTTSTNNNVSNIFRDVLQLGLSERVDAQTTRSTIPSYTLEVYDSTVSDKFEKVDPNSLKNFGLDTYPYVTTADSNVTYYQSGGAVASSLNKNDSFKSITQHLEELKSNSGVFPSDSVGTF